MRRLVLIMTMLLGGSAAAQPSPYEDRPERCEQGDGARWTLLSDQISPPGGRLTIGLGDTGEVYRRLRIQALQGTPTIRRIEVVYLDGASQVFEPNEVLDPSVGRGAIEIGLDRRGRPIRAIELMADQGRFNAHYQILGQRD